MELFTSFTDVSYKHYWLRHLVLPRHRYSRYTLNFNFMPEKWYALCVTPLITTTICEKLKRRYYSIFFSERRVHLFQLISLSKSPNDNQKETENMIELELFLIVLWYYVCAQCLSLLVLNSPYNRLKQGLLTKVARQLRPLLALKGKLPINQSLFILPQWDSTRN